jgi:UDP-glucose 4-epimerase
MKCLVTGCAGFIGSTLSEELIKRGHEVVGADCFTDYYPRRLKENNLRTLLASSNFSFIEKDIVDGLEVDADFVFHLAAQPGVRKSWGLEFDHYTRNNILLTQRLLESCKNVKKFIFASSSSVYGGGNVPFEEDQDLNPISPYGISKLCCEHLCKVYSEKFNVAVMRLFTVYGPRQRPDMAFNKFIKAALKGEEIIVYGNGEQRRDFTYVDDIVEGLISSAFFQGKFEIFNLGSGRSFSVNEVLETLESLIGRKLKIKKLEQVKGDMSTTLADISKAWDLLKYQPKTSLNTGLRKEIEWISKVSS